MQQIRLEQVAALFVRERFVRAAGQRAHDARVEEVELRVRDFLHLRARAPGGQPVSDQCVDEDFEVALHGGASDRGVARHACDVHHLRVHRRRHFEEACKRIEILHHGFLADLLRDVVLHVGFEQIDAVGLAPCGPHRRQRAEAQRVFEPEASADLRRGQRKEAPVDRAARQKVRASSPEFARARTGECEAVTRAAARDQALHLVE